MIHTELSISTPIINPDTAEHHPDFQLVGKVDSLVGTRIREYKTVGNIEKWMTENEMSLQREVYAYGLRDLGYEVTEFEYCVVERPSIKMCKKDASPRDFENRCVEWLDDSHFKRVISPVSLHKIKTAAEFLWSRAERITQNRESGTWLTDTSHCCKYRDHACEFLPLCRAAMAGQSVSDVAQAQYTNRKRSEEFDTQGKTGLSYSSAVTLSKCELMYFFRYEARLKRTEEEYNEPATIGTLSHKGLELYATKGLSDALVEMGSYTGNQRHDQDLAKARAIVRVASLVFE
jgi:hypothetical protein